MIFVIAPLVQERQTTRQWLIRAAIYAAALVATVILFNTLLAAAAQRVQLALAAGPLFRAGALALVGALALLYSANEIGLVSLPLPALAIQVPRQWATYGLYRGAAIYGAALGGAGFITYLPFASYHAMLLWNLALGLPWYGALLGFLYGLARVTPVFSAAVRQQPIQALVRWKERLYAKISVWHLFNALTLSFFGAFVLVMALR